MIVKLNSAFDLKVRDFSRWLVLVTVAKGNLDRPKFLIDRILATETFGISGPMCVNGWPLRPVLENVL